MKMELSSKAKNFLYKFAGDETQNRPLPPHEILDIMVSQRCLNAIKYGPKTREEVFNYIKVNTIYHDLTYDTFLLVTSMIKDYDRWDIIRRKIQTLQRRIASHQKHLETIMNADMFITGNIHNIDNMTSNGVIYVSRET